MGQNRPEPSLRAYVFLSDECPMCQGYAPVLNKLAKDFEGRVAFIGIFPNFYATDSSLTAFKKEYNLNFECLRDSNFFYTDHFKATVTPQIFIEKREKKASNTEGVLYAGQIDDAYFRAGKRRGTTSIHYVREVLNDFFDHKKPEFSETAAMGCIIVKD
ncbi:MAG: redoxin domain-containing protein [Saprospiraceae bacterium]|nr:redoxin domain-containing protein [Saprospiraceae bacterium]